MNKDKQNFFKNKTVMVVSALFCCLLWGSAFPAVKSLMAVTEVTNSFQKIMLAGMRFSLSGVMVLIFSKLVLKSSLTIQKGDYKHVVAVALFQTFFAYAVYYVGLSNTTGVRASIIMSTGIFMTAIMSLFAFKGYRLSARMIAGMFLGLSGVVLINSSALSSGFALKLNGEGFLLISAFLIAYASIYIKKYASNMDVIALNGYQLLLGGLMLIAVAYMGHPQFIRFSSEGVFLLIYLSFLSAAAFSLWYVLIKHNDVAEVTLFKFTVPIFGSVLSIVFLPEESFSVVLLPALALISVGIVVFSWRGRK